MGGSRGSPTAGAMSEVDRYRQAMAERVKQQTGGDSLLNRERLQDVLGVMQAAGQGRAPEDMPPEPVIIPQDMSGAAAATGGQPIAMRPRPQMLTSLQRRRSIMDALGQGVF